jgi:polysaccharide biosynthesis protein PslF
MINILPAVLRVLRPQARVVVTMHGFHETRYRWRLRATPMLVAPHRCILVHPRDYALLTRTLPIRNRSELVPIWSNIPSILSSAQDQIVTRESLGLAASDRVVVFFGDMREEKGVLELLEAVSRARSRVRRLKVMLVGALQSNPVSAPDSYKCELLKAMQQAQRENELVMVRNPEPIRVAQLLRAADLAVFPFRNGAAGNRGSVLAAIVNEVAVLTTSGTSTPDGFAEEYGVDTVPAGALAALTNRMVELLLDPRQVTDLRRRSSRAAGRFSWDAIAERHLEIYRGLLPPASQRAANNLQ